MNRKKHTRKLPCEVCGVSCGSSHTVTCKWAYTSRQEANKLNLLARLRAATKILLNI